MIIGHRSSRSYKEVMTKLRLLYDDL